MTHRRWPILLIVSAVAAAGYFLWKANPGTLPKWRGSDHEISVTTATVRRSSVPVIVRLTGELAPVKEAKIVSRLGGKVTAVHFNVGDSVSAGTVVAVIHSGALARRAADLRSDIDAARKVFELKAKLVADAEERLAQSRELHERDLIARRDLDLARTAAETARAQAQLAQANLAQQEAMLAQVRTVQALTRLSAPIDGVVSRRWLEPGATIAESGPLLTIVDLRSLKMTAEAPGVHPRDVRNGSRAQISTVEAPDEVIEGKIARVDSLKDVKKPTAQIEIHIDNRKGILRPGMATTAIVPLEQRQEVLLIPRSAVISADERAYVYKPISHRAMRQTVALGGQWDELVEIKDGVKEGESVIVDQLSLLKNGSPIRVSLTPAKSGR
jgi:RND family efflux transporter MFP subunit